LLAGLKSVSSPCPRHVVTNLTASDTPTLGSPTEDLRVKLDFPPFVKELFISQFNKSVLSYAEVINYERYHVLNEQTRQLADFFQSEKSKIAAINERGVVPEEILVKLKSLDLPGLLVPSQFGGAELMHTEALRLYQELGSSLAISELFRQNELLCTRAIVEFGSDEQKLRYLDPISKGDLWTAFCQTEQAAGSDPNSIRARTKYDPDSHSYHLTGTKTWVSNAIRANLFLVFAKTQTRNYLGELEDAVSAFLVDGDTPGVQVSQPYDLAALNGLQVCDVNFNCHIPASALLGAEGTGLEILQKINHGSKYFMAAGIVNRLRDLLDETASHVLERKQYGAKLSEFELIRLQIARCASRIYALESMLYITSGLADVGTNPDVEVESAIIKQFASESFDYVTRVCLGILGAKTNIKGSKYQEYLAENQALQSWQGSSNIIKCYIGISGIIYLAEKKGDYLVKCKQFGLHPYMTLKYAFAKFKHRNDFYPNQYKLDNHVHPRLAKSAPLVEWSAHKLAYCAEHLLFNDGLNVQVKEGNLERLSDIAMETFAMICVLSRASRSYVVGHAHAQHEMSLAIPFIFESRQRVEERVKQCAARGPMEGQRDLFNEDAGAYIIEHGGYIATHPLIKNSF